MGILDWLEPTQFKHISYDDLNRLVQGHPAHRRWRPVPIEDYDYDAEGNRISRTHKVTDAVETCAYDSQTCLIG